MKTAQNAADLSYCIRGKVGAVIVKNGNIISFGYNGTPSGFENCCEEKEYHTGFHPNENDFPEFETDNQGVKMRYRLITKSDVLHAEENAILKLAREGGNANGATMFCTRSVCQNCAKMVIAAGIKEFYFLEKYRTTEGLDMLEKAGVTVIQMESL
jgi:dCMP deaminase